MKALLCPRDEHALLSFQLQDVAMARCRECEGFWLDGTSLKAALTKSGTRQTAGTHSVGEPRLAHGDTPECPHCSGTMPQQMQPVMRSGVEVDVCPSCHGAWLDKGEWERAFPKGKESFANALRRATENPSSLAIVGVGAAAVGAASVGAAAALSGNPSGQQSSTVSQLAEGVVDSIDVGSIVIDIAFGAVELVVSAILEGL
jgi:Zn-finger nucleic acid-binding protein